MHFHEVVRGLERNGHVFEDRKRAHRFVHYMVKHGVIGAPSWRGCESVYPRDTLDRALRALRLRDRGVPLKRVPELWREDVDGRIERVLLS